MQISQVFISDNNAPMGKTLESGSISVRAVAPNANHKIYNDEEIRALIKSGFGNEVTTTYESLAPYAYKADLARYCILHEIGGWYFDIGMRAAGTQVNLPNEIKLIAFREINKYTFTNYACDNCVIFAKAKTEALAKAIEMIVENTKNKFYGISPLCPTGPSLWGRAIAMTGVDKSIVFGDSVELTPGHQKKNKAMVLPDGSILAFKKQAEGGDLAALGASGTNNYNEFWHQRRVYLN
jgi:mannosyltransferase OCH1-like enzyme